MRLAGNKDREALEILKAGGIENALPREAHVEDALDRLRELIAGAAVS